MGIRLDTRKLDELQGSVMQRVGAATRASAFVVQGTAAKLAPYDTGALSNSIMAKEAETTPTRIMWRVQDGVEYGIFQELGFHTSIARSVMGHTVTAAGGLVQNPFMVPAIEQERQHFLRAIRAVFR